MDRPPMNATPSDVILDIAKSLLEDRCTIKELRKAELYFWFASTMIQDEMNRRQNKLED